jgi:hypothetical protein
MPGAHGRLQKFERGPDIPAHRRPVHEQHVDMIQPKIAQAHPDAFEKSVGGKIVRMDFGRYTEFVARNADFRQRRADICFVAVHLRGVEGAISGIGRRRHCRLQFAPRSG